MKNILITGASGYIGGKLARALDGDDDVAAIVGVDIREPVYKPAKLEFVKKDVRDPLAPLMKARDIDVV
ncbi:MAG: NAD-dependent epimerase/dehydratase family protein, partial [Desulfobacterales bacterium]|nr:NAD-dependent epimerase/dehydratase family protein [Desulfobacterales bacterium]